MDVRSQNWKWLEPWESGDPTGEGAQSYSRWIRSIDVAAARGTSAIFIIEYGGRLVGEVSVGAISYGSIRSAIAGYWVSEEFAGRSFVPTALARVCDWAFSDPRGPRLHRVEVALLPNNDNSKRVVQKLCFSYEGIRKQYMFVHGAWRDHETWSLLSSSVQGSVVDRI
jgi:ribosomal-protein-alanine N-acetyltransferase